MKRIFIYLFIIIAATFVLPSCSKYTCPTYKDSMPFRGRKKIVNKKGKEPWKGGGKEKKGKKKGGEGIIPGQ